MCSIHKVIAMELETAIPLHTIRDMPHIGSLWSIGAVHRDLCPLCTGLAPSHSLKKARAKKQKCNHAHHQMARPARLWLHSSNIRSCGAQSSGVAVPISFEAALSGGFALPSKELAGGKRLEGKR